jgi:hypothetical protein
VLGLVKDKTLRGAVPALLDKALRALTGDVCGRDEEMTPAEQRDDVPEATGT